MRANDRKKGWEREKGTFGEYDEETGAISDTKYVLTFYFGKVHRLDLGAQHNLWSTYIILTPTIQKVTFPSPKSASKDRFPPGFVGAFNASIVRPKIREKRGEREMERVICWLNGSSTLEEKNEERSEKRYWLAARQFGCVCFVQCRVMTLWELGFVAFSLSLFLAGKRLDSVMGRVSKVSFLAQALLWAELLSNETKRGKKLSQSN